MWSMAENVVTNQEPESELSTAKNNAETAGNDSGDDSDTSSVASTSQIIKNQSHSTPRLIHVQKLWNSGGHGR
jgi:hypothetical protein